MSGVVFYVKGSFCMFSFLQFLSFFFFFSFVKRTRSAKHKKAHCEQGPRQTLRIKIIDKRPSCHCFLRDNMGLITSHKNIIFVPFLRFLSEITHPFLSKIRSLATTQGRGVGNLIRPPFCLFPAQTRQPPLFYLACHDLDLPWHSIFIWWSEM